PSRVARSEPKAVRPDNFDCIRSVPEPVFGKTRGHAPGRWTGSGTLRMQSKLSGLTAFGSLRATLEGVAYDLRPRRVGQWSDMLFVSSCIHARPRFPRGIYA